jgi:uncharacterized phiE125 gp8 family phage protein
VDYYQVGHWALSPVSTGASTEEPIGVADMRGHLRVPSDTDDFVISGKLAAARQRIEARTLRPCLRAQYDLAIDRFPGDGSPIRLPRLPLVSVQRVTYFDVDGTSQDFGSSGFQVDTYSEPGRLCLKSGYTWPSATRPQVAGVIRFTAGYSSTAGVGIPDPLVEAIRKLTTELYENREAVNIGNIVNALPLGYDEMLSEYLLPEIG